MRVATTPVMADSGTDSTSTGEARDMQSDDPDGSGAEVTSLPPEIHLGPGDLLYTVQPGDSLDSLAEQFYGDPAEYRQIVADNQDLPQPDGRTLADARQIFAGYRLVIRNPSQVDAHRHAVHVVKKGDTLSGIAVNLTPHSRAHSSIAGDHTAGASCGERTGPD
jgi:nucleoid-associated protein YgaU